MSFPNVSDLVATTLEHRSSSIADNVTDNNALLNRLKAKGKVRPFGGGRLIYEQLSFADNANGGWYSGYDTLPVQAQDVITAAEYAVKLYAVPVVISGQEELANDGEDAILDLLEERIGVAEASMANAIALGLYGDGTASGGKTLVGLDAAVPQDPTTGTYGGINRATWTFWRSQLRDSASTPTVSTIQTEMNALYAACSRGPDAPDLIVAGNATWLTFLGSLQLIQRITDPSMAKLGFNTVKYMNADVVLDGGIGGNATSTDMYFLNTKYLHFRPHKKRNMVPLDPKKRHSVNQDASVTMLGFAGAFTTSGAQFQGRGKFD
jgi:hypothetical protein